MPNDEFAVLGLGEDATAADVQAARRDLARRHHPDQGGDADLMRAVNAAADAALRSIAARSDSPGTVREASWSGGVERDVPSFTVEALPVETFEALLVVCSWIGEVLDDDPPYRLEAHLFEPTECWCRLDLVPDAGASTVSLTVAGVGGVPTPDVVAVRDLWVANLNLVDWA
jgi:hypothetical protein